MISRGSSSWGPLALRYLRICTLVSSKKRITDGRLCLRAMSAQTEAKISRSDVGTEGKAPALVTQRKGNRGTTDLQTFYIYGSSANTSESCVLDKKIDNRDDEAEAYALQLLDDSAIGPGIEKTNAGGRALRTSRGQ